MIPLDRLLEVRGRWQRTGVALFLDTFEEERAEVVAVGRRGIRADRWLASLLTVWEGAGDEWGEIVEEVIATEEEKDAAFFLTGAGLVMEWGKAVRDQPDVWRSIIALITTKAEAIVETTMEEFALLGVDAWESAEARAGVMGATEAVQSMGLSQSSIVKQRAAQLLKVWQAITDERTRPSHLDANGQIRKLSDSYDVGGALLDYPADAGGPLREVINCRCWEDYILPEIPPG